MTDTAFESSCNVHATEVYTELRKILYTLSSLHRAGLCAAGQIRLCENLQLAGVAGADKLFCRQVVIE